MEDGDVTQGTATSGGRIFNDDGKVTLAGNAGPGRDRPCPYRVVFWR